MQIIVAIEVSPVAAPGADTDEITAHVAGVVADAVYADVANIANLGWAVRDVSDITSGGGYLE